MAYTVLSSLVEAAKTTLDATPEGLWEEGYKLGQYVSPEIAIDPLTQIEQVQNKPKLFIVPLMTGVNIDDSLGRRIKTSLMLQPAFAIVLLCPFTTTAMNSFDVGSWEEGKKILNLRETIDIVLASADWGKHQINSVEVEPAQEVALKTRTFFSVTEFQFNATLC